MISCWTRPAFGTYLIHLLWGIVYPLAYWILERKPSMAAFFFQLILFGNMSHMRCKLSGLSVLMLCLDRFGCWCLPASVVEHWRASHDICLHRKHCMATFYSSIWRGTLKSDMLGDMWYLITSFDLLLPWEWQFVRIWELNRFCIFWRAAKEVWSAHGGISLWRSMCWSSHRNGHKNWPEVYVSSLFFLATVCRLFLMLMHWILCAPMAPLV